MKVTINSQEIELSELLLSIKKRMYSKMQFIKIEYGLEQELKA